MAATTSLFVLSLGKTAAQITAQLAPVPALLPLVDVLCGIIQLCENVVYNRNAARQLRDRCHTLVLSLREYEEKDVNDNITQARNAVHDCLLDIQTKMSGWASLGKIKSFVQQDDIAKDIAICNNQITDCMNTFQLTSHFEIHEWMSAFKENQKLDHQQLLESLSQIQSSQAIVEEKVTMTTDLVQRMMVMIQTAMGENKQNAEKMHEGLSANLYQFQSQFHELLPDFHLQSGEVKKIGEFPVRGTATMDIYEGLYLGREKVAIKAIRSMKFDEQSKRRFTREAKIWGQVWKRDRGMHIVPFYGYCQLEGPFPCMVSPWQKNGDAITFVKANDKHLDYIKFIVHIARGVEVLHSMELVHGDIRAINILVNDQGLPLLSDFGLSKIIQDVSGAPLTQSSMMADSCRHFAPEAFQEDGVLSTATDIYALAMTILEIMTHQQPYRNIKHHFEAGHKASQGIHPDRPTEIGIVKRGLSDDLWRLLVSAWSLEPSRRPTIHAFTSL
ncbi:kinase-like domain-containing protein [Flammula alnicola]|nr:kinase-like domain-containing protein [Flammula alnicola]